MAAPAAPPAREVHTLVVEVGRKRGDGLPEGATGAALLCYCAAVDEGEAVRETVAVLRTADLAVLEVEGLGTRAGGEVIDPAEAALMDRALAENAVIVAQVTPFDD